MSVIRQTRRPQKHEIIRVEQDDFAQDNVLSAYYSTNKLIKYETLVDR